MFHAVDINNKRKFQEEQGAGLDLVQQPCQLYNKHGGNTHFMGSTLLKFLGPEEVHIMSLHPVCEWAMVHLKNICKRCKRTHKKLAALQQVEGDLFTCWQMTNPLRENLQVLPKRLTGLQTAGTKLATISDHAGEIPWLWWVTGLMDLAAGKRGDAASALAD